MKDVTSRPVPPLYILNNLPSRENREASYPPQYNHLLFLRDHHLLVIRNRRRPVDALVRLVLAHYVTGTRHVDLGIRAATSLLQDVLLLVDVAEGEVEHDGQDTTGNGGATKNPGQVGISNDRRACETNDVGCGCAEKVDSRDQTTHVDGCAGICNAVRRDVHKQLRDAAKSIREDHIPNGDGGYTATDLAVA